MIVNLVYAQKQAWRWLDECGISIIDCNMSMFNDKLPNPAWEGAWVLGNNNKSK